MLFSCQGTVGLIKVLKHLFILLGFCATFLTFNRHLKFAEDLKCKRLKMERLTKKSLEPRFSPSSETAGL